MRKIVITSLLGVAVVAVLLLPFVSTGIPLGEVQNQHVEADCMSLASALEAYVTHAGQLPSTKQGLKALVEEPTIGPKPVRWTKIMIKVPPDPWGNPYGYRVISEGEDWVRYELGSAGRDGKLETADDWAKEIEWKR